MKRRRSLISRVAGILRRKDSKPAAAKASPLNRGEHHSKARGVEPLEGRIAPASLIDAHTVQFNDLDGDLVTVSFSKDLFASPSNQGKLNQVFVFSNGTGTSLFDANE